MMQHVFATPVCSRTQFLSLKGHSRNEEGQSVQQHNPSSRASGQHWSWASPLMAAILALSSPNIVVPPASIAEAVPKGSALFQKACIGCHDLGGNILQPGATLFTNDLLRNGVDTEEGIYNITYYGKGRMPGFGEKCTPRGQCTFGPRLQDDEIKMLAEFVKSQADKGWRDVESNGD